ncbi:uncharacterized protein BDR25DRAFT_99983 [Lindgomyces ingoldianus]|uniref:Uncharacterized protein n=1 Tax=Lindgomyces ingoldianus TaxID=673940 RepID=A0ACB6R772_9PLEO|nr:uncharacterized protein BDR25DRAFT_99983 [Lindgomyces ingoldianus]KAF2475109.1 hypothetical protein BDR25DRAFT_99983 [Lindgomyces ingoldianus]
MGLSTGTLQGWNENNLARALEVISKEINHDSTHFLLEFIQNADDNSYSRGVAPALEITYHRNYLRVDCNETGFTENNVDAICSIGNSTKARSNSTNTVGEKGIGFKSVFKVADRVYIASNSYQFMFDRHETLGMIAPKWASLPIERKQGYTTFVLEYSPEYDKSALRSELQNLDPRILLFLHKLRNLTVRFANPGEGNERILQREDSGAPLWMSNWRTVALNVNYETSVYAVMDHIATCLPADAKRANATQSQVILAFPIHVNDTSWTPKIEPQQVYAFLPIRDYGFEFLIHADLILNAGREDIAGHSDWNKALRDASLTALVKAASDLAHGPMPHTWFRYLPTRIQETGFFRGYAVELMQKLSVEPLLKSHATTFERPENLTYVPDAYQQDPGEGSFPLMLRCDNQATFLASQYDAKDLDKLRPLGVVVMDLASFSQELGRYVRDSASDFRNRSSAWHSRLAQVLAANFYSTLIQKDIHGMRLIPLRDGQWVSGSSGKLYFSGDQQGLAIPDGLQFRVIDPGAEDDDNRAHLFKLLGVTQLSIYKVCDAIIEIQDQVFFLPSARELLSQALFLYSVNYRSDKLRNICLVAEDGECIRAGKLYADISIRQVTEEERAVVEYPARFFHERVTGCRSFKFLHHSFLHPEAVEDQQQWHRYLLYNLQVAYAPRLALLTGNEPSQFSLHDDFNQIVRGSPATTWLSLIRNNWRLYCEWLENDETESEDSRANRNRGRLRDQLAAVEVQDINGNLHPLKDTFLPLSNLVNRYHGVVPFLDISNPDDPIWQTTLRPFGVGTADDLQFYLRVLQNAKSRRISAARITDILTQVQARAADDELQVRTTFRDQALVCVPQADGLHNWTVSTKVVWKGPKCLRKFPALAEVYPQLVQLFCNTLGLKDAEIEHLVNEISEIRASDQLPYITELFSELEKMIKDETPEYELGRLTPRAVLPVQDGYMVASSAFRLVSPNAGSQWYIPDRPHLESSFRGKVPLLAFPASEVSKLKRLIKLLHLESRKLGNCVTGTARTEGRILPFREWTDSLRAKADCILRLVPDTTLNRRRIFQQLREVEVFTAPKVVQHWSIWLNGAETVGEPQDGRVALTANDDGLKIYFSESSFGTARCRWEFAELIADFCGISNDPDSRNNSKSLLLLILNEGQVGEINEILDTNSIPPLLSDHDLEDAENEPREGRHRRSNQSSGGRGRFNPFAHLPDELRNRIRVFAAGDPIPIGRSLSGQNRAGSEDFNFPDLDNVRVFGFGNRGPFRRRSPDYTMFTRDRQHASAGEVIVSNALKQILCSRNSRGEITREWYEPTKHWTSIHRIHSGHPAYTSPNELTASFTIPHTSTCLASTLLTQYLYLVQNFSPAQEWLLEPPNFHIEVKTTTGGLASDFVFSNEEFERARKYMAASSERPRDVVVLVRVWNVGGEAPRVDFLPDIWGQLECGSLSLRGAPELRVKVRAEGTA